MTGWSRGCLFLPRTTMSTYHLLGGWLVLYFPMRTFLRRFSTLPTMSPSSLEHLFGGTRYSRFILHFLYFLCPALESNFSKMPYFFQQVIEFQAKTWVLVSSLLLRYCCSSYSSHGQQYKMYVCRYVCVQTYAYRHVNILPNTYSYKKLLTRTIFYVLYSLL